MRIGDEAAVLFELRLAGAAQADAALVARQVRPHLLQARQRVFELGQLDLQPGLRRAGPRGEDVEDQLAAVEDLDAGRFLQVADLAGDRSLSKMTTSASVALTCSCSLVELALADVGAGMMSCRFCVSSPTTTAPAVCGQAAKFVARVVGRPRPIRQGDADQNGTLLADREFVASLVERGGDGQMLLRRSLSRHKRSSADDRR